MSIHTAKLISATPNAEETIVYCARVSNPKNQKNLDTAPRLLRYCMKHGHFSIFEQAHMTVEVNTTPDVSRQMLRHHDMRFQEFSQRYADINELGGLVLPNLRKQDTKNRQNSTPDLDPELKELLDGRILGLFGEIADLYSYMLEMGVAKETARAILPIGGTRTRLYATANLRTWCFFLRSRTNVATQLEHRLVAESIKEIFCEQFPVVAEAFFGMEEE